MVFYEVYDMFAWLCENFIKKFYDLVINLSFRTKLQKLKNMRF